MNLKGVSFWCIVLAIIVAMTLHHILSYPIIEGQTNDIDTVTVDIEVPSIIEEKDEEIERKNQIIDMLRRENMEMEMNLQNSQNAIENIQAEASRPVEEEIPVGIDAIENIQVEASRPVEGEIPVDVDGSEVVEDEDEEEIIFPIDIRDHFYEITTCGKIGMYPPLKSDCSKTHTDNWYNDPNIYDYNENKGIHIWTVPKTGSYIIEVAGAEGGSIKDSEEDDIEINPGKGAVIRGIFYLKEGDKYKIVVGQMGTTPKHKRSNPWNGGAGAGGGTFMWKDDTITREPLIVAGGGGGQGVTGHKIKGFGGNGSLTEEGTMGPIEKDNIYLPDPTNIVNNFGKDGEGGGDPSKPSKKSKGWSYLISGESIFGINNMFESESGFGGGGIMHSHAGGGGGGYSGGGSKRYGFSESNTMGGGGGGSYFDENGFKREDSKTLDYNEGDGYIKIKLIKDYFFVEGNKVKCKDHGGYEPSSMDECSEASKVLGFEWKTGPRKNGWNNDNCSSQYSKCIWSKEIEEEEQSPECNNVNVDKGLIYNEKCKGMDDYIPIGVDNIYKTVCVSPGKALSS